MPMPGAFSGQEPEVDLPVTESEGGDFEPSGGQRMPSCTHCFSTDTAHADEEMTIDELEAEFQGDDLESDEDDSDYLDDFEDGDEVEIEFDEEYDSDGNYVGDPALAEAERLATAAEVANEETAFAPAPEPPRETQTRHTLAVDGEHQAWLFFS